MGGVSTGFLQRQGEARYARTLEIPATRGRITDRNGVVLASSVPARAVWAIPEDVDAGPEQLNALARLLQMNVVELKRRLADDDRTFVYLRRQVDADVAERIAALKLAGIHSTREFKRHYPEGATNAHVIGFTNVEDRGQEGIELAHERLLAGRAGSRRVIKDRLGRVVEDDWLREPLDGKDLALSIDNRIQYIAHAALKNALDKSRAKAGAAIVFDVKTGEVLALANLPSFDPNLRGRLAGDAIRNRVLTDTFEPGSTMKPFSVAAALEAGKVKVDTRIQTAPGRLTIGNRTIGDAHAHGMLTVEEMVAKSSNVGTAKIALDLPRADAVGDIYRRRLRSGAAARFSRRGNRTLAAGKNVAADRAGDDFLRPWRIGNTDSTCTRLLGVRERWLARAADITEGRCDGGAGTCDVAGNRPSDAQDA